MTFSLRWLLITLAVIGAGTQATAMSPRIALLATAQSFGQDHQTSPVPVAGPECQGCCESSNWLHQMVYRVPYLGRMFAPPKGVIVVRAKVKIERENLEAQHALAVAGSGDWFARARATSPVTPAQAVWAIRLVGHKLATPTTSTSAYRVAEACCGSGAAVAGGVAPSCGVCPKACDGSADAFWPVPTRVTPMQVGPLTPFFVPGVGTVRMSAHGSQNTLQICPATPMATPTPTQDHPFLIPGVGMARRITDGSHSTLQVCPATPMAPPAQQGVWIQRTPTPAHGFHVAEGCPVMPPQVHAQLVQAAATSAVPSTPPALKMQASQVQLSTSQMEVAADRMQHVGDDVLLEGNVRILLKRGSGEPVRVTAARVVVNLRDNSFRVGQAITAPTPTMPVSNFGVERIFYQAHPTTDTPTQPANHQGAMRYYVLPVQATTPAGGHTPVPSMMPVPYQLQLSSPR